MGNVLNAIWRAAARVTGLLGRGPSLPEPASDWGGSIQWKRVVNSDPRDGWWLALPSKLLPRQVEQIKRAGLGGDIWQQWQLQSLMEDSWPMFRKCSHELRQSIAMCRYMVRPAADDGDAPSEDAQKRAELVQRALNGMRPDPFTDERGRYGTVYNITDAILNGLAMLEILWPDEPLPSGQNMEILPRATVWIHPRHYTFSSDGRIEIVNGNQNRPGGRISSPLSIETMTRKFICAQYMSRSGSALSSGLMRPLATWWSYWIYGREWIAVMAQKHGTPFLHATYKPGQVNEIERAAIEARLRDAGANGYMLYPEGVTVNIVPPVNLGSSNPITELMRAADEACMYLLLGQTATTVGTPGTLGAEAVRGEVKRENIEAGATWVGDVLTEQFARAVLLVNYGTDAMLPTIEPDFTQVTSPDQQAARWATLLGTGLPFLYDEFCRDNAVQAVRPGDVVVQQGAVRVQGDIAPQNPVAPDAVSPDIAGGAMARLREALAAATDGELETLRQAALRASESGNGAWGDTRAALRSLLTRTRD